MFIELIIDLQKRNLFNCYCMRIVLIFFTFLFCSCANRNELAILSITKQDLEKDISVLSADSLEGRAPLSIGETRTVAYLQNRMREIGLEPVFGKSYSQGVPLVKLTSHIPEKLTIHAPNGQVSLKLGDEFTANCPALKENIDFKSSEIIFAGFGINNPEKGWNDFEGIDVKGKTIIVLVNDPDYYTGDTTLFNGKAMTYQGRWRYKFEEAERQGATACFIVHEEGAAGYPWSVTSLGTNKPNLYIDDDQLLNPKCLVTGWITKDAASKIFSLCNLDYEVLKQKASIKGFRAINMKATYSISVKNQWIKSVSQNIAGIIKGSERPDEAIVYCAHWDHLGIGSPVNGDSIYNGASDNAAAIGWMFSIAKAFKNGETPKRSIFFLSPTAEESGLLGSSYFVDHSPIAKAKIVACINTDVILFLGKFKDVTVTGLGHSELDNYITEEAKEQGRYVCPDPNPENGMFFRSDQLPFLKAGVPAIFAKGYSDQVELGKEVTQDKINEYWRTVYHKPCDIFNPQTQKLDGLIEDAKLFYSIGYRLANESYFPKWYKKSEFYTKR
jgi:Zn-dependent M28 family amino/carboxypeptidase